MVYATNKSGLCLPLGEFGVVYKAHFFGSSDNDDMAIVAVKTLKGQPRHGHRTPIEATVTHLHLFLLKAHLVMMM